MKLTRSLTLILMIFFSFACQEDSLDLPRIEFLSISIDSTRLVEIDAIKVSVTIKDWQNQRINSHGIVINQGTEIPSIAISERKETLGTKEKDIQAAQSGTSLPDTFSYIINDLIPNTTYTIAAFVEIEERQFISPAVQKVTGNASLKTLHVQYESGLEAILSGQFENIEKGIIATNHGFVWGSAEWGDPTLGGSNFLELGSRRDNRVFGIETKVFRPGDKNKTFLFRSFAILSNGIDLDTIYGNTIPFETDEINYWSRVADMGGGGRHVAVGFSVNNLGYVATGKNETGATTSEVWRFDPITGNEIEGVDQGSWEQVLPDVPDLRREEALAISTADKGYLGTGYRDDFWEFDPSIEGGRWRKLAPLPGGNRAWAAGFSIGEKIYAGLGSGNNLFVFDPEKGENDIWGLPIGEWEPLDNVPNQIRGRNIIGFSLEILPGEWRGYLLSDRLLFEYDPSTNNWQRMADFPNTSRINNVGFVIGQKAYIGTGGSQRAWDDFWEFDPNEGPSGVWKEVASFPFPVTAAVAFTIGDKGYVGTGFIDKGLNFSQQNTAEFWEFTP